MINMMNNSRLRAVKTDKAESAQNLFDGKEPGQMFLVAQAVLQSDDGGSRTDQRWEKLAKLVIRGRLESNEDQVTDTNAFRRAGAFGPGIEVALRAVNGDAVAPDPFVVGAQEEMDLVSSATQFGAIITAHRAATHHRDFHWSNEPLENRRWGLLEYCRNGLMATEIDLTARLVIVIYKP